MRFGLIAGRGFIFAKAPSAHSIADTPSRTVSQPSTSIVSSYEVAGNCNAHPERRLNSASMARSLGQRGRLMVVAQGAVVGSRHLYRR